MILDFVSDDLKNGTLMEVPLDAPIPRRVIGFACPPQDQSQTLREFLAFCSTPQA